VLVCRADDAAAADFITPTTISRGDLRIAISTGGASPALARRIRHRLDAMFDESFGEWVRFLAHWRRIADEDPWDPPEGREVFLERITEWSWLTAFRHAGEEMVADSYLAMAIQLGLGGGPE
jgi:precorrin-2 dehydrogenase/sirohydrochlorin ferrochelatase